MTADRWIVRQKHGNGHLIKAGIQPAYLQQEEAYYYPYKGVRETTEYAENLHNAEGMTKGTSPGQQWQGKSP